MRSAFHRIGAECPINSKLYYNMRLEASEQSQKNRLIFYSLALDFICLYGEAENKRRFLMKVIADYRSTFSALLLWMGRNIYRNLQ